MFDTENVIHVRQAKPEISANGAFGQLTIKFKDRGTGKVYEVHLDADYYKYLMEGLYWAKNKASDDVSEVSYAEMLEGIDYGLMAMRMRYWYLHQNLGGAKAEVTRIQRRGLQRGFYEVCYERGEGETEETQVIGPLDLDYPSAKQAPPETVSLGPISRFFNRIGL